MLDWNATQQKMDNAARRFERLKTRFDNFTKDVRNQINAPRFMFDGLTCDQADDDETMTITFAGKTLQFVFSTIASDKSGMTGCVRVYLVSKYPERKITEFDSFTFDHKGMTNLFTSDGDPVSIDADTASLAVAILFVSKIVDC